MRLRNNFKHPSMFLTVVVFVFFCTACSPKMVVVGSPFERYDHNRTQSLVLKCTEGSASFARTLSDKNYNPDSDDPLCPKVFYDGRGPEADHLPAANVVPIFTGISLPLKDIDRTDLIDFLSTGPLGQAGIEPKGTEGNETKNNSYREVLDLVSSMDYLKGDGKKVKEDRKQMIARLKEKDIEIADRVVETRYFFSSFADILAFRKGDFWFVLYKLPKQNYYSRLVVVPATLSRPDKSAQRP